MMRTTHSSCVTPGAQLEAATLWRTGSRVVPRKCDGPNDFKQIPMETGCWIPGENYADQVGGRETTAGSR